jgi:MoaA/NifB/PqqE/SkfB family radical SAM enzyme
VTVGRGLPGKAREALVTLLRRRLCIECDGIPYEFDNVPLRKVVNWILTEASIYVKPGVPWAWPTHLQIEPTTLCNLKCALCPVTSGMDRELGHMEFSLFKQLLDEAGQYALLVLLWDWGEPFVNPEIFEMIAYAKGFGLKVISSSNGHAFADEEEARRLVESGIDSIIIAVDGITQDTYERYRQSGRLETALTGIRNVVAQKRAIGRETPLVNFRFLVMAHNEHEIPGLKDLAQSLDVDVLSIKTLNPYASDMYAERRDEQKEFYNSFMPDNERYRRFKSLDGGEGQDRVRRKPPCKNLWNAPTVHWDGTVCSCTYDYHERQVFGDLKVASFREIWFGERSRRLRREFRLDWEGLQLCSNCSYAYEGGSCWNETIAEVHFSPWYSDLFSRANQAGELGPLYGPGDRGRIDGT